MPRQRAKGGLNFKRWFKVHVWSALATFVLIAFLAVTGVFIYPLDQFRLRDVHIQSALLPPRYEVNTWGEHVNSIAITDKAWFATHRQGVFRSLDRGQSWQDVTERHSRRFRGRGGLVPPRAGGQSQRHADADGQQGPRHRLVDERRRGLDAVRRVLRRGPVGQRHRAADLRHRRRGGRHRRQRFRLPAFHAPGRGRRLGTDLPGAAVGRGAGGRQAGLDDRGAPSAQRPGVSGERLVVGESRLCAAARRCSPTRA